MNDCSVRGCSVTEGLLVPIIVIPAHKTDLKLHYRCDHMTLCPEHSGKVGSFYDFFVGKPNKVRGFLRSLRRDLRLDFDNAALMFEPVTTHGQPTQQVSGQDLPQPGHGRGEGIHTP